VKVYLPPRGIAFQNWMAVALAIILVAITLTWLLRR